MNSIQEAVLLTALANADSEGVCRFPATYIPEIVSQLRQADELRPMVRALLDGIVSIQYEKHPGRPIFHYVFEDDEFINRLRSIVGHGPAAAHPVPWWSLEQ